MDRLGPDIFSTSRMKGHVLHRAQNASLRISLRWPIHIINPVDKTNLSCNTPHRRSTTVSLETYPFIQCHMWPRKEMELDKCYIYI